ncbi:MAG: type I-U CRISPR-associated helicase/endonuclease Cas3 [Planctomycetaceae bacterium]|nr:type I-U CRISPR-associated helicase/endonuclease Cas3 [Planctomycetaceae bacterium]
MTDTDTNCFVQAFEKLTTYRPFPWQIELYRRFLDGQLPRLCNLPTGLGKTSIIAVWLLALVAKASVIPRRLVYVVNRRTVVDQTTHEVEKLRDNLRHAGLVEPLRCLCAFDQSDDVSPLAISTLRGQFADNREWSFDPARPAVIVGTVDMIGSRLLFSGYGIGFRSRPLHAAFLGQDALLVHDEAHLEPAFQELVEAIETEQRDREHGDGAPWPKLRVMALSATTRATGDGQAAPFELTDVERRIPVEIPDPPTEPVHVVWKRMNARKKIDLIPVADEKNELADKLSELALSDRFRTSGQAVLVFARTVDNVERIVTRLKEENTLPLTGTLRGLERDKLRSHRVFCRFLPPSDRPDDVQPVGGTAYLVCTSAGEVGVNISADHLICDLTTFESMAQRFGRVNRFGDCESTEICVVHPTKFADTDYDQRRQTTLSLLQRLEGDASPLALTKLDAEMRREGFAPIPEILPVTDVLFDCWSLTSVRDRLPGRPPVEPYLHGIPNADWQPPDTYIAWREEVDYITGDLLALYKPEDLLADYPLKQHELIREPSHRAFKHFQTMARRNPMGSAWLLDDQGHVEVLPLDRLADNDRKDQIDYRTVILPPSVGGLKNGMLNGASETANDVSDEWYEDEKRTVRRRVRMWQRAGEQAPVPEDMRTVRRIETDPERDESENDESAARGSRIWCWYTLPWSADDDLSRSATVSIRLPPHVKNVTYNVKRIVKALELPDTLQKPLVVAAKLHDLGKQRIVWQRSIGNPDPTDWHAKSGRDWTLLEITSYRHEFGSLLDIIHSGHAGCAEFDELDDDGKDLVLHLIAAHHGRGRPHFSSDEVFDPEYSQGTADAVAIEVPRRFARLQHKFGRWGLAYVESLLRAADWAASAAPSPTVDEASEPAEEVS